MPTPLLEMYGGSRYTRSMFFESKVATSLFRATQFLPFENIELLASAAKCRKQLSKDLSHVALLPKLRFTVDSR